MAIEDDHQPVAEFCKASHLQRDAAPEARDSIRMMRESYT
jgi:hypothetical protein